MSEPAAHRDPIQLHLAVTATVIVAATWTRDGRKVDRQFIKPLHVRGLAGEIIGDLDHHFTRVLTEVMGEVEAAEASSQRGYMSRFRGLERLQEPSPAKPGAPVVTIPPPSPENAAAIAAMIADEAKGKV